MKNMIYGLATSLTLLIGSVASATPITSFENGSTLADNGLTRTLGIASRATIESSVFSYTTLSPTDGDHLLKMIAGTSADIINPTRPNDLVTLVDFNSPVYIDKAYFLVDFAFMNRQTFPRNDRQLLGINGTVYDLIGSAESGYDQGYGTHTLGWQTLAIHFASPGSIRLSLGCLNDTYNASSSYCLWDNFRTADFVPVPEPNGIPVIQPFNPIDIGGSIAPIPEPSTYALMLAGLGLLTMVGARRKS